MPLNDIAKCGSRGLMIMMRAASWLGHHIIDEIKFFEIRRNKLHRLGSFRRVLAMLPQNRGTSLGADHRIISVLEHDDAIRDTDSQGTTGSTLA